MTVLPWEDMVKWLNLNTGFFETSLYTLAEQMFITSGNWDNAGASFGNMQYNYGTADRAQELFLHMVNNYESIVRTHFVDQTKADDFINVTRTYTRAQRITWADGITDWGAPANGHALLQPWKDYFGNLLITPECSAKYFQMVEVYYLPNALDLFKGLNCTSRASLASLFDLSTNRGRFYPVNSLVVDFETIDANVALSDFEKEAEKVRIINNRGNDESNGTSGSTQTQFVPRRSCQAEQGGTYFGSTYDPEVQFNITQDPAIVEKEASTSLGVKIGTIDVDNVFLGTTQISSIYLGANLLGSSTGELTPYESSKVPDTQFRILTNSYVGVESGTINVSANQPVWVDVQNWLACKTYYTTNGSTPTTASSVYYDNLKFAQSCTLKTLTVSVTGVAEAVKTATITVAVASVTSVSPTSTTQNTIPFNVTLTNNQGNTIYYKVGAGTQQTYTSPFPVSQSTNNVGVNILVTYWSTGETEKTITYNTAGATVGTPTVTATPANSYVSVDWNVTTNATSYNVYRSTVAGTIGTLVSEYLTVNHYDDNWAINGTTYYYTVRAANYGGVGANSTQVSATPSAPAQTTYRYVRVQGYGDQTGGTTRIVEFQAKEGATNRLLNKLPQAGYAPVNGGAIGVATNGAILHSSGYPLWWTGAGTPTLTYDLGALYPIDTLLYVGYSPNVDPRQTKFKLWVSTNNVDWIMITDRSLSTTVQPEAGFAYAVT
jgi:hypothetical protein